MTLPEGTHKPAGETTSAGGKNIVVLCDGTANQVTVYSRTNVVRLARRLDKATDGSRRQVVFYDPGLGTEGAPGALTPIGRAVTKILGLAFGYGLSKNLADAYGFLMQHYEPGDRIYIFGFSRGAYTARALTGLLGRVGLLERGCDSLVPYAIRYYQARDDHQLNFFKQRFSRTYALKWREVTPEIDEKRAGNPSNGVVPVHFLGVWDTVKSVGTLRRQITLPDTDWLPNMINGRHAVALDEKRNQYKAEIWQADTDAGHDDRIDARWWRYQACLHQDVETMWFAGVHADVGGGYGLPGGLERELIENEKELSAINEKESAARNEEERKGLKARSKKVWKKRQDLKGRNREVEKEETGLAHISLQWMMEGAEKHGLLFDKSVEKEYPLTPNPRAKLHNPLRPYWWLLGWSRRPLPAGAQVHASVDERKRDCAGYEPAARAAAETGPGQ